MRSLRIVLVLVVASLLAGSSTLAAPSASQAKEKDEKYVMEDFKGFQADYFKEAMDLIGIKVKLVTPKGKKGKAKSDWVVVSTDPAEGKTVNVAKKTVTAVVRKEDETASGIKRKDTYLACLDRVKKEYPNKPKINGGWDVTATDKVSTLTGTIKYVDESGVTRDDLSLTCSISKSGKNFRFEDFEVM